MRPLDLIYTRDISLAAAQLWWTSLLDGAVRREWGMSISTQVCHFNGRALEAYRVREDVEALKAYVAELPLSHRLFSKEFQERTRTSAIGLRQLFAQIASTKTEALPELYGKYIDLWSAVYPGYMFSIFLPGSFADAFRLKKGQSAESYIAAQFENRVFLEGLFEGADAFMRGLAKRLLERYDLPEKLAHLLTLNEVQGLINAGTYPDLALVEARSGSNGYVLVGSELIVGKSFKAVLEELGYAFNFFETQGVTSFSGVVAYADKPLVGRVRLVFTKDDAESLVDGEILVTAMTSPDFLSALKRAQAVITDEGGITCHAAIVSREMRKPCIIGTKIATQVLKDGDEVVVDTEEGKVTKRIKDEIKEKN